MNKLLALLAAAPPAPEIQDPVRVANDYRTWRMRIFCSMFVGYAFYYFTRKSLTFAIPTMILDLGFDKGQVGLFATIMSLTYGLSKFLSGILGDRANARYFISIGLILTGVFNVFFGMASSILWFAIFWGLNGWFQGFGAPPCSRLLTYWYSKNERGRWWAAWNISHNIGGMIIPLLAGFCAYQFGWRYALFIPGALCIAMGFILMLTLRDTPESMGLPPVEKYRNDAEPEVVNANQNIENPTTRQILVEFVLKNKYIWMLAITFLFIYIIRTGFNDWTAIFLVETKGYSQISANGVVSIFEVGGLFGSLVAGWMSDRLFQARRGPVNALYAVGILGSVLMFWNIPEGYPWLDSASMFLIGFTIFGPQLLIGVAAAEFARKKAAATATGFVGWFAYAGSALAGYPLGRMIDGFGWEGFFMCLTICSIVSVVMLVPLWSAGARSAESKVIPEGEPNVA